MTNFFRTSRIIFNNPYINPYMAFFRHCGWQFRKIFGLFPYTVRMGDVEIIVPDRSIAKGSAALANAMGYYDPNNMRFIEELFSKKIYDTFFDIGANLGFYSLITANCGNNVKVYAFEPHPYTYSLLQNNVRANHAVEKISCFQYAFGDRNETVLFQDSPGDPENHVLDDGYSSGKAIEVNVCRGDNFCQQSGITPQVIKIDVEGYENHVLEGFSTILKEVQLIFVECWDLEKTIRILCETNAFLGPYKIDFQKRQLTKSDFQDEDWVFVSLSALTSLEKISYTIKTV